MFRKFVFDNNFKKSEVKMKRPAEKLSSVKEQIAALKGEEVEMSINRGRKKIDIVSATVADVYPSVFTVKIKGVKQTLQTFSYFDVLCGNVTIQNS